MKNIKLTRGHHAIVDDEDYQLLAQWSWCYHKGYAIRSAGGRHIYMHRVINKTPEGMQTDHINLNRLDNRRCNLRTVTRGQNNINRTSAKNTSSRYKGVTVISSGNFAAQIKVIGEARRRYIGTFLNEADAALAYNLVAYSIYGEAARLNGG